MEKFVVDRSRHLTGEVLKLNNDRYSERIDSCLLHPETGLQCCLGQYAEQRGLSREQISDRISPQNIDIERQDALPKRLFDPSTEKWKSDSRLSIEIQTANDLKEVTREERERRLIELFAKLDIELSFEGDANIAIAKALDYLSTKGDTTRVA